MWAHATAAPRHLYNSSTLHTECNTQSAAAAVCRTHPAARGRYQPSSVTAQRPLGTVIGGGALRLPSVISALRLSGTWREENEKEKKKKRRQLSGSLVTLASQLLSKVFPLQSCRSTSRMTQHKTQHDHQDQYHVGRNLDGKTCWGIKRKSLKHTNENTQICLHVSFIFPIKSIFGGTWFKIWKIN